MKDLKIGDWVVFCKSVRVGYGGRHDRRQVWETGYEDKQRGQVAGIATRYTGKLVSGTTHYMEECDPGYLDNPKRITLWEVRLGMTNKPILVRDEDIEKDICQEGKLPVQHQFLPSYYREDLARIMRDEMKNWPRDKKGRWLKNDGPVLVDDTQEEVSR